MKLKNLILTLSVIILIGCTSDSPSESTSHLNKEQSKEALNNGGFNVLGKVLPFFGPLTVLDGDTSFYQIPKFYLTDQDGEGLGYSTFDGKIMVVDFFFTTCSTICPIMTSEMEKLQRRLKEDHAMEQVRFLSVTINPETDTPETLKSYAVEKGADLNYWKFATGELAYIDELSKEGFFLAVDRDAAYQDGIIHSSQLILVDADRHIRGSYDGIDKDEMDRLFKDIKALENE
ncbi:MAG: SCO family protein [Flavobacteriales bacterium]